ncbi:MAG: ferredoxin [Methanobrevibacter thaueri]|jgi:Pyruvate/2-oxoacid:ferredoxin oxidoreductase delta subunit|uniref:Ferredoxin n=1 Tax=Methanobrevibacter thaueri TaxID=190975 RepID=A0A8T3VD28_9EURY|nr:ferredoxin [Methanobrevibacter thaueri]MBE6501164.1 ferredoxin [Methanobrevibacter thaueri]
MRFRYHQPIPNFYEIENPHHPQTTITDDFLKEFTDIAVASRFAGLSYAKLGDEFKSEWEIDWDNIIILKYPMSEEILRMEPSREKCILMDEEFQEVGAKAFALADILRENGFKADLINPLDDRVSLRAIALQSNDAVITRSNMCLFKEGLNLGFFMIETSIENLPFKTENELEWVRDYCSTCGVCIDRCPEKAFDDEGKFLRKLCTAHREGCSVCINFCPFYKRGYEKVKKRYSRMKK